jgi:hypothetical protein
MFVRIVITFLLLLQVFINFFTHINFVKLSRYNTGTLGGGKGYFRLTVLIRNKRVATETNFYKLKKILQNMENLKSA